MSTCPTAPPLEFFNARNASLGLLYAPPAGSGLSFVGVISAGERIAKVRIVSGNLPLGYGTWDGQLPPDFYFHDLVAMDDMIYAEPSVFGPPTGRDACKQDGWKRFDFPRTFANQGDCIQFVNTGK